MSIKAINRRQCRRWNVLAWLAWSIHLPTFAAQMMLPNDQVRQPIPAVAAVHHALTSVGQIEMHANDSVMPSQAMFDCAPCATCYMGPAVTARMSGSSDRPDGIVGACWFAPQQASAGSNRAIPAEVIGTTIALRILHCRWLN